jgi:hypothetical protein
VHPARPKVPAIITLCLRFCLCVVGPFFCGEPSLAHGKAIFVRADILRSAKSAYHVDFCRQALLSAESNTHGKPFAVCDTLGFSSRVI